MTGRLTRRGFAAGAMSMLGGRASAGVGNDADLTLVLMGDLHSGYAWSSRLLQAVRSAAGAASGDVRIVVNGDVFERHNVVAQRGGGVIDLALIRAFADIAPTLVTIGNHDSDLFDPRNFAAGVAQAGAVLVSDIADPRSGELYGVASHRVVVRGRNVVFAALGTPVMSLYPTQFRQLYRVPDPVGYAVGRLPALFAGADLPVALVHAGFMVDRSVLPHLHQPFLLHGAHDHLRFSQPLGRSLHLQSGAWSSAFQLVTVRHTAQGPAMRSRDIVLDRQSPQDPALQRLIDDEMRLRLQPSDRVVLGHLDQALGLDAAVPRAAGWIRGATGAGMALLSHTTFGDGLPGGAVTAYDLAGFLRFDGGLSVGEVPPDRLDGLLARVDQFDGRTPYARRTGDYLYASMDDRLPRDRPVRAVVNSYAVSTQANRLALFGWDATGFAPLQRPDVPPTLGGIIARGLAAGSAAPQPTPDEAVSLSH